MERSIILGFLIGVVLHVFLQVDCSADIEATKRVLQGCKTKLGPEKYEKIITGFDPDAIAPEQKSIAIEFNGCMWKDLGYINEEGVVNEDILNDHLVEARSITKEVASKIVQQCKNADGKDYSDKAYKINLCIHRESKKKE